MLQASCLGNSCGQHLKLSLIFITALLVLLAQTTLAVKREDFKTCDQSSFCRRQRSFADSRINKNTTVAADSAVITKSPYSIVGGTSHFSEKEGRLTAQIQDARDGGALTLELSFLKTSKAIRLRVTETNALRPRYDGAAIFGLAADPSSDVRDDVRYQESPDASTLLFEATKVIVTSKPFRIDVEMNDVPVVSLNKVGLMNYERYGRKPEAKAPAEGGAPEEDRNGEWEETFKGSTDSKPNGPASIALDVTFTDSQHVYGIPQHASPLSLKSTRGPEAPYSDPYRLYNLDVFEYEIDNPMALYGSIPYMTSHKKGQSAGVLWLNSAETWIDVWKEKSKTSDALSSNAHWMSESGQMDAFIVLASSPTILATRYAQLTGFPAMPPAFSIAYHQCRWNYNNQKDVEDVDKNFDIYDIPYDVLWLDIEHTDGKRYFTWDSGKFPEPKKMIDDLSVRGRKLVTIVDPHVKRDDNYFIYSEASKNDYFIKNKDGKEFDGWCWPGASSWIDYTIEGARSWWAAKFAFDQYKGSTPDLFVWNDMNEPSVFSGPEITMPKDAVHDGGWEHRDVHNLFGMLFQRSTAEGLTRRTEVERRPFVLSRAFFAGSQRYGAIWTGDNTASWEHLAIASPMVLASGVAGLPFAGADVGGFFGNPEIELLVRWYQAGAYQPFFRAHAHFDTKRREPWLFGEPYTGQIRDAIRARYALLPYWYTLFWKASMTGVPMMRPMYMEFPDDETTYDTDDQWMVGNSLLVKPATAKGQTEVEVSLPGVEPWYDYKTYEILQGPAKKKVAAALEHIPVFVRGGSIVPRKDRIRRSSKLMASDPITYVIALDSKGIASGELYLDDGETFAHESGAFVHIRTTYDADHLFKSSVTPISSASSFTTAMTAARDRFSDTIRLVRVERLIVLGAKRKFSKATVIVRDAGGAKIDERELQVDVSAVDGAVVIKDPNVWVGDAFEVQLA